MRRHTARSKRRPSPEIEPLAALPNLGATSARWLYDAGIKTPAALRRLGALKAFHRVAMHRGGRVPINLLYALDGALRGVRWDHLPVRIRRELKAAIEEPTG